MILILFLSALLLIQKLFGFTGVAKVQSIVWSVYLFISKDQTVQDLKKSRAESYDIYKARSKVSAQDEYAKWTKLNRSYDAIQQKISDLNSQVSKGKVKIDTFVSALMKAIILVPLYATRFFYRGETLFFLPANLLPWYVEELLSFPPYFGAVQRGGVSVMAWCFLFGLFLSNVTKMVSFVAKVKA